MSEYMTSAELARAFRGVPLRTLQRWAKADGWRHFRAGRCVLWSLDDARVGVDVRRCGAGRAVR